MTKAIKITLIAASSTIGAGIISAVSYVKGKRDGIALANKQHEQLAGSVDTARNTRTSQQAQA